jgi:hypothetical protein
MWDPQRLTTLWAFTACYRDSFTFFFLFLLPFQIRNIYHLPLQLDFALHSSENPSYSQNILTLGFFLSVSISNIQMLE